MAHDVIIGCNLEVLRLVFCLRPELVKRASHLRMAFAAALHFPADLERAFHGDQGMFLQYRARSVRPWTKVIPGDFAFGSRLSFPRCLWSAERVKWTVKDIAKDPGLSPDLSGPLSVLYMETIGYPCISVMAGTMVHVWVHLS